MSNNNTKVKFKRDDQEQIDLGKNVLVNAFKSKCKYRIKAIEKALKKLDVRDVARLPKQESLSKLLGILTEAMNNQKRPEEEAHGWQKVVKGAYDELTGKQMNVNDIKPAKQEAEPAAEVKVPDIVDQENLMEQDAEQARKEAIEKKPEVKLTIPFSELPEGPFPEEFDLWQSDAYSFMTTYCHYNPDGLGTVTMPLSAFEKLFMRQYERRIAI